MFASPRGVILSLCALLSLTVGVRAQTVRRDVVYASIDGRDLSLDVHLPETSRSAGLIVWIHGGAWRSGSKNDVDLIDLVDRGWALASVDYRLSPVARFPAQVHDIKAAIRFLRAHAGELGVPDGPFIASGSSAGGHLAALMAVSNGNRELEGTVGEELDISSDVDAAVVLFGASNLTSILHQSTPHGLSVRRPALDLLLGGQPDAVPELARLASPVFHVDANDPPMLWLHGDQDPQMPINQAHEMQGAYERAQRPILFRTIHGAAHGGPGFSDDAALELIDHFLRQQLGES